MLKIKEIKVGMIVSILFDDKEIFTGEILDLGIHDKFSWCILYFSGHEPIVISKNKNNLKVIEFIPKVNHWYLFSENNCIPTLGKLIKINEIDNNKTYLVEINDGKGHLKKSSFSNCFPLNSKFIN